MLGWLVQTHGDVVPLVLRLTLAVVMFPHGAQNALGWFGGYGFKGTLEFFRKSGVPLPLAVLAIMAEFLGPLGLAVGLLKKPCCRWTVRIAPSMTAAMPSAATRVNTTCSPSGLPSPSFSTAPACGRSTR